MAQPLAHRPARAALERDFDETGIAAVEAAKQMHRVRKVTPGMTAVTIEERREMWMAREPLARDTRELGGGNADRLQFD